MFFFWLLIGAGFGVALVLYLLWLIYQAKYSVDSAPRVPMFICDKHGPLAPQYVMKLDVYGHTIEQCEQCWVDKMKKVKEGMKK